LESLCLFENAIARPSVNGALVGRVPAQEITEPGIGLLLLIGAFDEEGEYLVVVLVMGMEDADGVHKWGMV